MSESPRESIALLIDADNSPAAKIEFIIAELANYGVVNVRRAYGNWKKPGLTKWADALNEHSIQPMQYFDLVKGKNATDMGLVIDAMDLLYTKNVDIFCLVTSDCDFTPLSQRLREDGKRVIGFGEQKTPEPFVASCSDFIFLNEAKQKKGGGKAEGDPVVQLKRNTKLMNTLRSAVRAEEGEDGWARLSPVGQHIKNQGPFDHRTYGFNKLSDLFAAIDLFEVRKTPGEGRTRFEVRLKRGKKKVGKKAPQGRGAIE